MAKDQKLIVKEEVNPLAKYLDEDRCFSGWEKTAKLLLQEKDSKPIKQKRFVKKMLAIYKLSGEQESGETKESMVEKMNRKISKKITLSDGLYSIKE